MAYRTEYVAEMIEENLPSLSPTTAKVLELANDINCSPTELTRVIKLDPVLSAKVLRLVNSAFFGLRVKIVSLEKATILLGLNTIKNLALSAAVLSQVGSKKRSQVINSEGFWKHSLGVGVAARMIAEKRGTSRAERDNYFIAGMLHDLGLIVEAQIFPKEMKGILADCRVNGLLAAEEARLEGLNHCQVGQILANRWNLSPDLLSTMVRHHQPLFDGDHSDLNLTIYLANIICKNNKIGLVLDQIPIEVEPSVFERLSLKPKLVDDILESLEGEIDKAVEFLKA